MNDLTPSQKKLADLFWTTQTYAKVRRRKQLPNGQYEFYLAERNTRPIDFRVDPGEFVFKHHEQTPSAPLSPMYINLRNLPENLIWEIAKNLSEITLDEKPDFCTGIPKAAIPYAQKYSEITQIPYITIYDKQDGEAKRSIIPASNAPSGNGSKLLIIDDLITKGNSKIEAFKIAEDLGYKVTALLVLFDRQEGGVEQLRKTGYKVYAAMQLKPTLEYYLDSKKISQKQYNKSIKYLKESK